ncbi:transglycosylase family protein [Streptacidiphilus cavernicola]|uniref:Transglycosylase family protein n=1 Tax=Streptacidiphilus cavernicola TaxID=3342716 RepID=A0ABV6W2X2_9ACTN
MSLANGRHRRPQPPGAAGTTLARAAGVTAAGAAALPVLAAGQAHAATSSVWDKVAACESSGDWHVNTGNGYYGGLQFSASTWAAYGGTRYSATAAGATEAEQVTVAQRVLKGQGPGAWPVCSVRAGLTRGNGASGGPAVRPAAAGDAVRKPAVVEASAEQPVRAPAGKTPAKAGTGHTVEHTVRHGDTLWAIAEQLRIPGGWQPLYAANRAVVGADPDLILPGEHLTWHAAATTAAPATKTTPAKAAPPAKAATAPKTATPAPAKPKPAPPKPAPAKPKPAKAAAASSHFVRPISASFWISEGYGVPGPWQAGHHTGVDLAVPVGTTVHAVGAGTVVKAQWGGDYGKMVEVRHADGRYSLYAHLSRIDVHVGEAVSAGTTLGLSGATGNVTGPHLHFEVDTTESYGSDINPLGWLAQHGVSLT